MHPQNNLLENYTGLLIFEISGRSYCLDYSIVASTLKPPFEITNGENGHGYSLITFKNTSIPLIDLEDIFNHKLSRRKIKDSRVIIIEHDKEFFGLLVGKITEVFALDTKFISTSIKFNPKDDIRIRLRHPEYIDSSLEIENKKLLLLDIDRITEAIKINKE